MFILCMTFFSFSHSLHMLCFYCLACVWMLAHVCVSLCVTHVYRLQSSSGTQLRCLRGLHSSILSELSVCICEWEAQWDKSFFFYVFTFFSIMDVTQTCRVLRDDQLFVVSMRSLPTLCTSFQPVALTFAVNLVMIHVCLPLMACVCVPSML